MGKTDLSLPTHTWLPEGLPPAGLRRWHVIRNVIALREANTRRDHLLNEQYPIAVGTDHVLCRGLASA